MNRFIAITEQPFDAAIELIEKGYNELNACDTIMNPATMLLVDNDQQVFFMVNQESYNTAAALIKDAYNLDYEPVTLNDLIQWRD